MRFWIFYRKGAIQIINVIIIIIIIIIVIIIILKKSDIANLVYQFILRYL